ncbi:hypothetical protein PR048_009778 [Dryococelus australis]|uniref:Uncharacterized protein n=1 Tax=Dryococelus australis TaxID=614101 RepID=A0ABQ9I0T8_9NEOP|nr:hypothetical protein PR048_009778 [Dryococelus australis]
MEQRRLTAILIQPTQAPPRRRITRPVFRDRLHPQLPRVFDYILVQYFQENFILSFGRPQGGVCSLCEECKQKIRSPNLNETAKLVATAEFIVHERRASKDCKKLKAIEHKCLKNDIIAGIVIDYMQKLPLPNIPVQELCADEVTAITVPQSERPHFARTAMTTDFLAAKYNLLIGIDNPEERFGTNTKDEVDRSRWLRTTNLSVPTLDCFSAYTSSENGARTAELLDLWFQARQQGDRRKGQNLQYFQLRIVNEEYADYRPLDWSTLRTSSWLDCCSPNTGRALRCAAVACGTSPAYTLSPDLLHDDLRGRVSRPGASDEADFQIARRTANLSASRSHYSFVNVKCHKNALALPGTFPAFEAEKRGTEKGENGTRIEIYAHELTCSILAVLRIPAVSDFKRWPYPFIGAPVDLTSRRYGILDNYTTRNYIILGNTLYGISLCVDPLRDEAIKMQLVMPLVAFRLNTLPPATRRRWRFVGLQLGRLFFPATLANATELCDGVGCSGNMMEHIRAGSALDEPE